MKLYQSSYRFSVQGTDTLALLNDADQVIETMPITFCETGEEFEAWVSGEKHAADFDGETYVKVAVNNSDEGDCDWNVMILADANAWLAEIDAPLYCEQYTGTNDVIEDQDLMANVPAAAREAMAAEILGKCRDSQNNSLAFWLTVNKAAWPVSDSEDTWEYDAAAAAWQEFVKTGHSGTDWFRAVYLPVDAE